MVYLEHNYGKMVGTEESTELWRHMFYRANKINIISRGHCNRLSVSAVP